MTNKNDMIDDNAYYERDLKSYDDWKNGYWHSLILCCNYIYMYWKSGMVEIEYLTSNLKKGLILC